MPRFNHSPVSPETPTEQAAHDAASIAWAATCGTSAWREATAGEWADYMLFIFRQRLCRATQVTLRNDFERAYDKEREPQC